MRRVGVGANKAVNLEAENKRLLKENFDLKAENAQLIEEIETLKAENAKVLEEKKATKKAKKQDEAAESAEN